MISHVILFDINDTRKPDILFQIIYSRYMSRADFKGFLTARSRDVDYQEDGRFTDEFHVSVKITPRGYVFVRRMHFKFSNATTTPTPAMLRKRRHFYLMLKMRLGHCAIYFSQEVLIISFVSPLTHGRTEQ